MNGNLPLISVIIPVFNAGIHLDPCLESIAGQTYTNLEIILVNDGSSDDSGEKCDRWAAISPENRKVIHTPNRGPSAARNCGIDKCHGELIAFLDSDDIVGPDYIRNLWSLLTAFPEADIAMTGFIRSSTRWRPNTKSRFYNRDNAMTEMLYQTSGFDNNFCGKLFRCRLFSSLRFREGIIYEDLELMARILPAASGVAKGNATDYFYRINPTGVTGKQNFTRRRLDVLDVTAGIMHDAIGKPWEAAARDRWFSANCNMFALLGKNGEGDSAEATGCWNVIKELRGRSLCDPETRLKSKIGASLSYLGRPMFKLISSLSV